MKRLYRPVKNVGIIAVDLPPKVYDDFKKKLFTALRKFGSGKKTRAVHKIVDKNIVESGLFSGDAATLLTSAGLKNNELKYIILNLAYFDDSVSGQGAVKLGTEIEHLKKKIQKEETFVNEARLHNLEKLQENQKETYEKFLKSLDYIKMVDGIYFAWLLVLARHTIENESATKPKITTVAADILASILKKLYLQVKNNMDSDVHQLIEAIAIYFIRIYFYGESSTYVLNLLKKAFKEDIIDTIKRTKVNKITEFNYLSKLLSETELLPITKNTFDLQMARLFGKYGYEQYVQSSLVDFLAFMANLAHPNQLFKDSYPVEEKLHERLEELLLNEQKQMVIKDREI
jgi:hypothetical protein